MLCAPLLLGRFTAKEQLHMYTNVVESYLVLGEARFNRHLVKLLEYTID